MQNADSLISMLKFQQGTAQPDLHHHSDYEIIFILRGDVDAHIGESHYHAHDGCILLITNLEQHSIIPTSEPYERWILTLRPSLLDTYLTDGALRGILKNHAYGFRHCIDLSGQQEEVVRLLQKMQGCDPAQPLHNRKVACYVTELLILLAEAEDSLICTPRSGSEDVIYRIQSYIDQNFTQNLSVAEIGRDFGISPCYLSHTFKNVTGYSPKQYIGLLRLRHSGAMLWNTALPVSQVASACGFSDINNFIKAFKGLYGYTPSQYRKQAH